MHISDMTLLELLAKADTFSDKQKEITMGFISAAIVEAGFEFDIIADEGNMIKQDIEGDLFTALINFEGDVMVSVLPGANSSEVAGKEIVKYAEFKDLLAEQLN